MSDLPRKNGWTIVVDELQEIVYHAPGRATSADDGPVLQPARDEWSIDITPTLLFRFLALTYNAHRIHYDRDYARDVEGYPGLVTHGPLQALAMAEAARAGGCAGEVSFEYPLLAPLFEQQGLVARAVGEAESVSTAVRDIHGRQTATGTLRSLGE
jgi:3-methylfumaryl-CoA hydratase